MNQAYTTTAQANRNKYLETSIQTATPAQLLIMLYDGAIRFCRTASKAIDNGQTEEAHRNIIKAEDILLEFVISLDKTAPVADGLVQLYDYMYQRLIEANTKKDKGIIEEVIGFLVELKETWVQAALSKSNHAPRVEAVNG
jgi:flagellar protein FliS